MIVFGLDTGAIRLPPLARALIFLAIAVAVCGAANILVIHNSLSASAAVVNRHLDRDAQRLAARLKEAAQQIQSQEDIPRLSSTPVFIDRIGQLAGEHGAPIQSIRPHPEKPDHFKVELLARYHDFEGFIASLEQLDVKLVAFGATLTERTNEDPSALFRIELLPSNNARQLDIPRLSLIRQQLTLPGRRNPFQRIGARGDGGTNRIDLSDILSLTGIAEIGDTRLATIDRQDFSVGDRISGREITEIGSDRVLLRREDASGTELYVLRFREVPAEATSLADENVSPAFRQN